MLGQVCGFGNRTGINEFTLYNAHCTVNENDAISVRHFVFPHTDTLMQFLYYKDIFSNIIKESNFYAISDSDDTIRHISDVNV